LKKKKEAVSWKAKATLIYLTSQWVCKKNKNKKKRIGNIGKSASLATAIIVALIS
jgi:hypothetical protein